MLSFLRHFLDFVYTLTPIAGGSFNYGDPTWIMDGVPKQWGRIAQLIAAMSNHDCFFPSPYCTQISYPSINFIAHPPRSTIEQPQDNSNRSGPNYYENLHPKRLINFCSLLVVTHLLQFGVADKCFAFVCLGDMSSHITLTNKGFFGSLTSKHPSLKEERINYMPDHMRCVSLVCHCSHPMEQYKLVVGTVAQD